MVPLWINILSSLRWGTLRKYSIPQYRKKNLQIHYRNTVSCQKQMKNRYRIYDLNYEAQGLGNAGSLSQTEPLPCLVCKGTGFSSGRTGGGTSPQEPPVLPSKKNCRSPLRAGKSLSLSSTMGRYQGFQDGGPQHIQGRFFMQKKYCLHCGFFSNTKHFHKIQGTTKRFPLQRKGEYSIFQRFWYFRTQVVQLCVLVSDRQRLPSRD